MSVATAVATGMRGAVFLALGRAEGGGMVENDRRAVIRSFWAIPLCLPAIMGLRLLDWSQSSRVPKVSLAMAQGRFLAQFLVSWLLFVVISHALATRLGKQPAWPRFIAVWAYCSVIENTLVAIGSLPGPLGAPAIVSEVALLVCIGWAFWLEWYATRLTLNVGALTAVVFVVVDLALGEAMAALGAIAG